MKGDIAITIK